MKIKVREKEYEIKGVRKVCGETRRLCDYTRGAYLQLNYDRSDGKVWTDYHVSFGHNSWNEYKDKDIITIGFIDVPMTMEGIKKMVTEELYFIDHLDHITLLETTEGR